VKILEEKQEEIKKNVGDGGGEENEEKKREKERSICREMKTKLLLHRLQSRIIKNSARPLNTEFLPTNLGSVGDAPCAEILLVKTIPLNRLA
jgi:hypothetical protein